MERQTTVRRRTKVRVQNDKENSGVLSSISSASSRINKKSKASSQQLKGIAKQQRRQRRTSVKELPPGVVDIDNNRCKMNYPYWPEVMEYLFDCERVYRIPLGFSVLIGSDKCEFRGVINDWLIQVQVHERCSTESLHLGIALSDLVCLRLEFSERLYQLVGSVCFFIGCKIVERYSPKVSKLVYLTDNAYTEAEFLKMETQVLGALDFLVNPPTNSAFLSRLLEACTDVTELDRGDDKMTLLRCCTCYVSDLGLIDLDLAHQPASRRAAAVTWLCRHLLFRDLPTWPTALQHYSHYTESSIASCVNSYASLLLRVARGDGLQAAREKYARSRFLHVSKSPFFSNCNERLCSLVSPL